MSKSNRSDWRTEAPPHLHTVYTELELALTGSEGPTGARRAVLYCHRLLARADVLDQPDGPAERTARVAHAWTAMQADAGWRPSYRREVRRLLANALRLHRPGLEVAVSPRRRRSQASHDAGFFTLTECMPWRVQRTGDGTAFRSAEYRLLLRVGEEMARCLGRDTGRRHMQSVLAFFDRLLFPDPSVGAAPLLVGDDADDGEGGWAAPLLPLGPEDWLRRYRAAFVDNGGEQQQQRRRRIGFDLFKRHMRYLRLLHAEVLHPGSSLTIPAASVLGRHTGTASRPRLCLKRPRPSEWSDGDTDGDAVANGAPTTVTDERSRRHELVEMLYALRQCACHPPPPPLAAVERVYAFSPAEVRRMVESASGTLEQLVLMLFLTTGLRIGGLSRLRAPGAPPPPNGATSEADVARELITLEKNERVRRIRPTACCRTLLARWYRQGRPPSSTPPTSHHHYVFPSPAPGNEPAGSRPISTRHLFTVCRGIFERAGVRGAHAHPHTFRHTVVQDTGAHGTGFGMLRMRTGGVPPMLFMSGSSFDAISKWIGHSSPLITSNVYGRLAEQDVEASLSATVPFLSYGGRVGADHHDRVGAVSEWKELVAFLQRPYAPCGDPQPTPAHTDPPRDHHHQHHRPDAFRPTTAMKRELLARARGDADHNNATRRGGEGER